MRKILFRGKRLDNGVWITGAYHEAGGRHIILPLPIVPPRIKVDPATVGQFTGLTDKNGMKIFEGDIIRHYDDNPYAGIEEKGVVFWDEEFLCFRRTSNGGFHHGKVDTYRLSAKCDYEVIGNIYDNPELLEEGEVDG